MEDKNKGVKVIAIIALVVAVVGITIAYAAMSTTLKITGSATMNTASWNIQFQNLSSSATGSATFTEPKLESTKITDYSVVLTKPGDSVSFAFQIANTGSLDASLLTLTKAAKPTCTGTGTTADADATLVCNNIEYTFEYADGTTVSQGDTLAKGATKDVVLTLAYKSEATGLPAANVTINGLDITLVYEQA